MSRPPLSVPLTFRIVLLLLAIVVLAAAGVYRWKGSGTIIQAPPVIIIDRSAAQAAPIAASPGPTDDADPQAVVGIAMSLDEIYDPDWAAHPPLPQEFQPIAAADVFFQFVGNTHLKRCDVELSYAQRIALVDRLYLMCLANHTGRFADFVRFRMPAEYTLAPEMHRWRRDWLIEGMGVPADSLPDDPLGVWEYYWDLLVKRGKANGHFYVDTWEAVATPIVIVRQYDRMPTSLIDQAGLLDFYSGSPLPSVAFVRSAAVVLEEDGDLICADASVMIRHRNGTIYPDVYRFFWDRVSGTWIPMELLVGDVSKDRPHDPEF